MDKNVSSVDLDELLKAREELDKEKGVDTDPNMYSDYNPDRNNTSLENSNAEENSQSENLNSKETNEKSNETFDSFSNPLNSEPDEHPVFGSANDDENKEQKTDLAPEDLNSENGENLHSESQDKDASEAQNNLSNYDIFSAFEVKENANYHGDSLNSGETHKNETNNSSSAVQTEKTEENAIEKSDSNSDENSIDKKLEKIDNSNELEDMLSSLLNSLDEDEEEQEPDNADKNVDSAESLYSLNQTDEDDTNEKKSSANENSGSETDSQSVNESNYLDSLNGSDNSLKEILDASTENLEKTNANNDEFSNNEYMTSIDIEPKFDENLQSETQNSSSEENENSTETSNEKVDDSLAELSKKASENDAISGLTLDELMKTSDETGSDEKQPEKNESLHDELKSSENKEENTENAEISNSLAKELEKSISEKESTEESVDDNSEILNANELNEDTEKEPEKQEIEAKPEPLVQEKPKVVENKANENNETEIITDYNQLKEILQKQLKESEEAEQEKAETTEVVSERFSKIDDFKFINEIATDEFKNSNKFSYILGKNEKNELVFGNFKQHNNLAVFGKNDEVVNSFLNSMILSLCLKNSVHEVNFVLLDSNIDSSFEVYNKSSYLYFNRIAKTNKEILDTLIEMSKEIDNRYEKLAELGVKNIEKYNEASAESSFQQMPYIVLAFNNYTSASQATDNDRINACLYQILKFGRIVGVYCVVTAKLPIETSQINYNLSSRLSFKSDEDSRYTVGTEGAESLPDGSDAIYFDIASNGIQHIKTATVTDTELDLIIKDLED